MKFRWNCGRNKPPQSSFAYELKRKRAQIELDTKSEQIISELIDSLKNNNEIIEFSDYGVGSKKLTNKRKVSAVLATSSSKGKFGKLLFQLTQFLKPKETLELGTSLGLGSIMLKLGYPKGNVTTVEACPNTHSIAKKNFTDISLRIEAKNNTFKNFLAENREVNYDLIFIDGHHDGEALLEYMSRLKPFTNENTLFILDDIRWSESMRDAWEKIIESDEYHTTVDFFRMGLVRYDLAQDKSHYCLQV